MCYRIESSTICLASFATCWTSSTTWWTSAPTLRTSARTWRMRTYKMMDMDKNMIDKDYIMMDEATTWRNYYCEEKTGEYGSSMMALRGRIFSRTLSFTWSSSSMKVSLEKRRTWKPMSGAALTSMSHPLVSSKEMVNAPHACDSQPKLARDSSCRPN